MRAHARLILETTLLDLCAPEATMPLPELIARLEALEQRAGGAPQARPGARPRERRPEPRPAAPDPSPAPPPAASPKPQAEPPKAEAPAPEPERSITPPAPQGGGAARRAPQAARAAARRPGARRAPAAQPVQTNSTQDLWDGFLNELARRSAPLAEITAKRARLVRGAAGVVPLGYRGLTEREQALLESPDGRRAVTDAFAAVHSGGLRLKVEIHGAGRGAGDAFTEEVRALFDGKVEG